jgi:hypothetical protein
LEKSRVKASFESKNNLTPFIPLSFAKERGSFFFEGASPLQTLPMFIRASPFEKGRLERDFPVIARRVSDEAIPATR